MREKLEKVRDEHSHLNQDGIWKALFLIAEEIVAILKIVKQLQKPKGNKDDK